MSRINRRSLKDTALVLGTAVALAGAAVLPAAVAQAADTPAQLAACNPCKAKCGAKCGAKCNPCAAKNPCGAKNACNPCGGKCNPCNPCAAKKK